MVETLSVALMLLSLAFEVLVQVAHGALIVIATYLVPHAAAVLQRVVPPFLLELVLVLLLVALLRLASLLVRDWREHRAHALH